jgi:hypothetical protein
MHDNTIVKFAIEYPCARVSIAILLTVICASTVHAEHLIEFPLQQLLHGKPTLLLLIYSAFNSANNNIK